MKDQYRQSQNIVKSVCKDGDVTKEWSSNYYPEQGLMESMYGGKVTLPECFNRVCELYPERKALGTRELLSEVDEKQPNGRVFKKVRGARGDFNDVGDGCWRRNCVGDSSEIFQH